MQDGNAKAASRWCGHGSPREGGLFSPGDYSAAGRRRAIAGLNRKDARGARTSQPSQFYRKEHRKGHRIVDPSHRRTEKPRPIGVPGTPLCRIDPPAPRHAAHNGATGLPRGARFIQALPATRQAAGAPSAWSQPSQSTHARPRRWCDAGAPGRQCVTADQKAGAEDMARNNDSNRDRGRIRIRFRIRGRWA